jgi:acyl CoA:acetate/3-ketoacid CoA transferase beta subunit
MTLADVCVVACAEAWRGDGEIVASPMGTIPVLGARLARATFEPDLVITDGEATAIANSLPVSNTGPRVVEGWLPFRSVFDVVWAGRRHVMMGASQIDRDGNQNIACIGSWEQPKAQLLGVRGAPGNTVNHATSYWVPNHSTRSFVAQVDFVSGVGYQRAAGAGPFIASHHEIRRVISNLGVFDFETADHVMRLRSVHPGVTVADVVAATGFELAVPDDVPESRGPTPDELAVIDALDPDGLRHAEVK